MRVSPKDHIQRQIFWYGYYEKEYILTWTNFVRPNDVVFDIGANIGYYSIIASSKAKQGRIYAIEPYKEHYNALLDNIRLNNIDNIEALNFAVSDREQEVQLFIASEENTGMTGLTKSKNFSGYVENVKAVSLDEWIKEGKLLKPNLIKMDIEGAEWMALQGMQMMLREIKPVMFIEIASSLLSRFGSQSSNIFQFMNELGYKAYQVVQQNKLKLIKEFSDGELIVFIPGAYKIPTAVEIL